MSGIRTFRLGGLPIRMLHFAGFVCGGTLGAVVVSYGIPPAWVVKYDGVHRPHPAGIVNAVQCRLFHALTRWRSIAVSPSSFRSMKKSRKSPNESQEFSRSYSPLTNEPSHACDERAP